MVHEMMSLWKNQIEKKSKIYCLKIQRGNKYKMPLAWNAFFFPPGGKHS